MILGIIGAFVGGWIFTTMGAAGVTGVNIYSIFVAVIGAVVVLVAYHAIFRAKDHGLIAAPPSHQSLQESQTLSGRRIQTWPNSRS